MAIISEKLVNFKVFENGNDLVGVADVELSTLTAMTESVKGAGIAGEFDAPVTGHFGGMEATFNWRTLNKHNISLMVPKAYHFDLRGSQDAYDSAKHIVKQQAVKCVIAGRPKEISLGKLDVGASTGTANKFEVMYIKISVDGETLLEYDKYNFIYVVDGVDYAADIRDALGLS